MSTPQGSRPRHLLTSQPNAAGPQTFRPKDAPRYVPAEIVIICCWAVCLCIMAFIYVWSRRQNTLKARIRAQPDYTKLENQVSSIPMYGDGCRSTGVADLSVGISGSDGSRERRVCVFALDVLPMRGRVLIYIQHPVDRQEVISHGPSLMTDSTH